MEKPEQNISMVNLLLNELKLIAKSRSIKDYQSMSKERLLSLLSESESVESATPLSKNSFDDERLIKITKDLNDLRDRLSRTQIKEIRKNLYDIKNPKYHSVKMRYSTEPQD